jgi:hypothetical protein
VFRETNLNLYLRRESLHIHRSPAMCEKCKQPKTRNRARVREQYGSQDWSWKGVLLFSTETQIFPLVIHKITK